MKPPADAPRPSDDELDALLRDALEARRQELPAPAQLGSLAGRLAPLLGPPAPSGGQEGGPSHPTASGEGSPPSPAPPAAPAGEAANVAASKAVATKVGTSLAGKVGYAVATAALVAAGGGIVGAIARPDPPAARPALSAIEPPSPAYSASEARPPLAVPAGPVASAPSAASAPPGALSSTSPSRGPRTAAQPPRAGNSVAGKSDAPAANDRQERAPPATPAAPSVASLEPVAPSAGADRPGEAELLRQARFALAADPNRTLALCAEHLSRFPRGALAQEREVIAVDALVRAGRTGEARARAAALLAAYPHSAHRGRLESLVGAL